MAQAVTARARRATSASWRTSMPARRRRRNGSCSTPGSRTRSAKCTKAPPSWTGWSRSRSAASPSRRPRRPASGAITASTSSTRPATSTSRPKSSARCACSTARSPCSTRSPASSRSRKPCGARPTSTACRASASSTRWTASARTSSAPSIRSSPSSKRNPVAIQLPIGAEDKFVGVVDLIKMKSITYKDETMGADYIVGEIPADMLDEAKHYREQLIEKVSEADDKILEKYLHGEEITEDEIKAALRKRVNSSVRGKGEAAFVPVICGSAFKNKGVQPLLDAVVDYLPSPLDVPPIIGHRSRHKGPRTHRRAPGGRRRAVRGAGVQDHDRPVRRPAHVLPRLLGRPDRRRQRSTTRPSSKHRAHRPPAEDARQQARGDQGSLRRRHRRGGRPEERHRPATRSATRRSRSCSSRWTSRSRSSRSRSSRRPRPTRRSSASACRS